VAEDDVVDDRLAVETDKEKEARRRMARSEALLSSPSGDYADAWWRSATTR
jgi:hypothetical protein